MASVEEDRLFAMAHNALARGLIGRDHYVPLSERQHIAREILAAVLPEHEKQVRAKLAKAIADVPEARDDEDPEYVEAYWDGRDDGARIARGEL